MIYHHKAFYRLIIDGGPKNKGFIEALTKRVGIYRLRISTYNSKANRGIEGNHNDMRNALAKMDGPWKDNLPAVLFAQRTSVKSSTSFTPHYLLFGEEAILPLETAVPTWRVLEWDEVKTTADLLALRARAFQRRDEDLIRGAQCLRYQREKTKRYFDKKNENRMRRESLEVGDLVLVFDVLRQKDMTKARK